MAGFVGVDVNAFALLNGRANDAQSGPIAAGGQRRRRYSGSGHHLLAAAALRRMRHGLQAAMSSSYIAWASG